MDVHYILGLHLYEKCTKICIPYLLILKTAAIKKKSLWLQSIPLADWTISASILSKKAFFFNIMLKKGGSKKS